MQFKGASYSRVIKDVWWCRWVSSTNGNWKPNRICFHHKIPITGSFKWCSAIENTLQIQTDRRTVSQLVVNRQCNICSKCRKVKQKSNSFLLLLLCVFMWRFYTYWNSVFIYEQFKKQCAEKCTTSKRIESKYNFRASFPVECRLICYLEWREKLQIAHDICLMVIVYFLIFWRWIFFQVDQRHVLRNKKNLAQNPNLKQNSHCLTHFKPYSNSNRTQIIK